MSPKVKKISDIFAANQNMRVLDLFYKHKKASISGTGNSSSKIFIILDLLKKFPEIKRTIWIVNDSSEQENLIKALDTWTDIETYAYTLDNQNERLNLIDRLFAISRLKDQAKKIIIAPYTTLLYNVPSQKELDEQKLTLEQKQKITNIELIEQLVNKGYQVAPGDFLEKGMYFQKGEIITIYPANTEYPLRVEIAFDEIESLDFYDQEDGKEVVKKVKKAEIYPIKIQNDTGLMLDYLDEHTLFIEDEIDVLDDYFDAWNSMMDEAYRNSSSLTITTFNEDVESHVHLHYLPVLKYRGIYDFISDLREKQRMKWKVLLFTKKLDEVKKILEENKMPYNEDIDHFKKHWETGDGTTIDGFLLTVPVEKDNLFPEAFQNPELKVLLITDKDISFLQEEGKRSFNQKVYLDFLTGLKPNDYVVHADHGIALFVGLEKKTIDEITREYLKLAYAENDKLFVPIDQADKISKYIGSEGQLPKLTRLGSAEWATITSRVRKETEEIAKELLILYAKRKSAVGFKYSPDGPLQEKFEKTFPYEETPGQIKSINDVKADMEKDQPMDRLICGDVGFGKTEVAMRAAFKAVQDKKQVALISPITILADQHYRSFKKRMDDFNIRVEMLSRFKSAKEQKEILKQLERGEIDIVIGTHRLIQPDIKFKDLGLVIVDEEQRFGVKQKEKLKELKSEVDILTLTATPIPRTLNICLNKLRDISTITTPPYGSSHHYRG